jgi:eukaryotic-like serine/threonine-protein kinase
MPPDAKPTLQALGNLANVYLAEGKLQEAETAAEDAMARLRRRFGTETIDSLWARNTVVQIYLAQRRLSEAEPLAQSTHAASLRVLGMRCRVTVHAMTNLAAVYLGQSKLTEAQPLAADAQKALTQSLGAQHPDLLAAIELLGTIRLRQREYILAEQLFRRSLMVRGDTTPDNWRLFRVESLLGRCLFEQGQYAAAEPRLVSGYNGMAAREKKISAQDRLNIQDAHTWIVQLYDAWGEKKKAEEWRTKQPPVAFSLRPSGPR